MSQLCKQKIRYASRKNKFCVPGQVHMCLQQTMRNLFVKLLTLFAVSFLKKSNNKHLSIYFYSMPFYRAPFYRACKSFMFMCLQTMINSKPLGLSTQLSIKDSVEDCVLLATLPKLRIFFVHPRTCINFRVSWYLCFSNSLKTTAVLLQPCTTE